MNNHLPSDPRYTIAREHTGKLKPQYVVRFCGDWVASFGTYPAAVIRAAGEAAQRRGCVIVEAIAR